MAETNIFSFRKILQDVIASGNSLKKERSSDLLLSRGIKRDTTHDLWPMDGLDGKFAYKIQFRSIMENEIVDGPFSFDTWVAQRKASGKSCNILDIFGGAYFLHDNLENVDSITGVRLKNVDDLLLQAIDVSDAIDKEDGDYSGADEQEKAARESISEMKRSMIRSISTSPKRKIIEGNYFDPETFTQIRERANEQNTNEYDLIIMNPIGGLDSQLSNQTDKNNLPIFYLHQLSKVYSILSEDEGILLINFPPSIWETLKEYLVAFPKIDTVEITLNDGEYDKNLMKLKKFPGAPKKLPIAEMYSENI